MTDLDGLVERAGRWAAARSTRRSLLARAGRVAVLVAGGPAAAVLLAEPAYARVCGQSGVSPKCTTYDCTATWGWCWYANGCCAGGLLKKICDCCAPNTPNPRGYCPSGTRVLCIVESCGADPRLMTKPAVRLRSDDAVELSVAISRRRFPNGAPVVVIGDADEPLHAAVAASTTRVAGGPLLLVPRTGVPGVVLAEASRLGAGHAVVVGPVLDREVVDAPLARAGVRPRRIGETPDTEGLASEVAQWSRTRTGARSAIVVAPDASAEAVTSAAAAANLLRWPLLVGEEKATHTALRSPRAVARSIVITTRPDRAAGYPGGVAVATPDAAALPSALADVALDRLGTGPVTLTVAPRGGPAVAAALAGLPSLQLHRPLGALDGVLEWLLVRRASVTDVLSAGSDVGDEVHYQLQSAVNEFDAHLLRGVGGQGLPVIEQPPEERPIGMARR